VSKRILIGCNEIPGYGGASTSSYKLFELLQRDGLEVSYLNIINPKDEEFYLFGFGENYDNPRNLSNVSVGALNPESLSHTEELTRLIQAQRPDVMVAMSSLTARIMKQAAPNIPIIFFSSGCGQAQGDFLSLKNHLLDSNYQPVLPHDDEKEAVKLSNLVITHSDSIQFLFQRFYPNFFGKMYGEVIWKAEWIYQGAREYSFLAQPFSTRDIDVLFVASSWDRPEKNFPFVQELLPHLQDFQVHLVGECPVQLSHVTQHSLISKREEMFRLLGRAKTLVCPSSFDAAPGILFEASALGCNIITSQNCGNWKICHPSLLADPFNVETVLDQIRLSLENKLPDNMDYFFRTKSYDNLVHILEVF